MKDKMKRYTPQPEIHLGISKTAAAGDGFILQGRHVYLRKATWEQLNKLAAKSKEAPFTVIGRLIELASQTGKAVSKA